MSNKIDLESLSKEDLISLKNGIDSQLINLERKKKLEEDLRSSGKYEKLSQIKRTSKILCINFHNGKVYQMDFVDIQFSKGDGSGYTRFSTNHDEKPMGGGGFCLDKG